MKDTIKFLHTADIHLGRPLKSASQAPDHLNELFNNASYNALKNIFDQAINRRLDFVVISGDLYDSEARSVKASRNFLEECRRLKEFNIPVYIISGNHDPGGKELEPFDYPENVYFYPSEEVEINNHKNDSGNTLARIIGQSYRSNFESRKMYTYYTVPDKNHFNLGLIHTQLNPDNRRYVPISQSDLLEKDDIHYWALGHIHQPLVLNSSSPALVYSGTPQGHNISEVGVKGCFIVEVPIQNPEKIPQINFIPTSPVIYKKIEFNITEMDERLKTLSNLQELLLEKAEKQQDNNFTDEIDFHGIDRENVFIDGKAPVKGVIIRWVITGHGPLHERISSNQDEAEEDLRDFLNRNLASPGNNPFVWTHSVQIRTSEELPDLEELKENEIYKEIDKIINEVSNNPDLEAKLLREWGSIWEGDEDHENRDNDSFYFDEETKQEIIEAARNKIIAYLFAGGDDI